MADPARLLHLFVVEDNPGDAVLIETAFRQCCSHLNLVIRSASDGEQAIEALQESYRPDLIVLDRNIPRIEGHDVLKGVRSCADTRLKEVPIVVFSSSERESELRKMLDAGANGYVMKPGEIDAYFEAIAGIAKTWLDPLAGMTAG